SAILHEGNTSQLFTMCRVSSPRKSLNRSDILCGFHNTDMPASCWRTRQCGVHSKPEVRDETYFRFETMAGDHCAMRCISDGSCTWGSGCGGQQRPQQLGSPPAPQSLQDGAGHPPEDQQRRQWQKGPVGWCQDGLANQACDHPDW